MGGEHILRTFLLKNARKTRQTSTIQKCSHALAYLRRTLISSTSMCSARHTQPPAFLSVPLSIRIVITERRNSMPVLNSPVDIDRNVEFSSHGESNEQRHTVWGKLWRPTNSTNYQDRFHVGANTSLQRVMVSEILG